MHEKSDDAQQKDCTRVDLIWKQGRLRTNDAGERCQGANVVLLERLESCVTALYQRRVRPTCVAAALRWQ